MSSVRGCSPCAAARAGSCSGSTGRMRRSTEGPHRRPSLPDGATGGAAGADDAFGGPWGGFVNIAYSWGNVDQTTLQDAYRYGSFKIFAGADYRVSDSLVLGGAISYSDTQSDFDQSLGKVKAATTSVIGYGTWYRDDWYVDGFVAYGSVDYDSTRNINIPSANPAIAAPIITSATSSPKGEQWSAAIGVGKDIKSGDFTVTPTARLGYIWVRNKAFSKNEPVDGLALAVNERTIRSLQSALGVKLGTTVNTSTAVSGPTSTPSGCTSSRTTTRRSSPSMSPIRPTSSSRSQRRVQRAITASWRSAPVRRSRTIFRVPAVQRRGGTAERDQLRPRAGLAQAVLSARQRDREVWVTPWAQPATVPAVASRWQ